LRAILREQVINGCLLLMLEQLGVRFAGAKLGFASGRYLGSHPIHHVRRVVFAESHPEACNRFGHRRKPVHVPQAIHVAPRRLDRR